LSDQSKKPSRNPGGRPKGVANKRSWNMRLELEAAGFEPLNELLQIIKDTDDTDKKWDRISWMVQFIYPRLKETEAPPPPATVEEDHVSERSTEELLSIVMPK
jgi:hypothetical protein